MTQVLVLLIAARLYAGSGITPNSAAPDLSSMSIEQLMDVTAASVLKTPGKLSQAPVAIYVITEEDIRRSGLTSIPELLRLVPGMDVGRVNETSWSISSRGFAKQTADKMLVLIDGRRVYDPLLSGVFWDAQDLPLYDIAQIEVIRGSGSSLWGADAVNGVVNIITKRARDTRGVVVQTGGGNLDDAATSAQYGGALGASTFYRVFGRYNIQRPFPWDSNPISGDRSISTRRGGFRIDSEPTAQDSLTLQGDLYSGNIGQLYLSSSLTSRRDGADTLIRWIHRYSSGSESTLQVYWDNTNRDIADSSWLRNTIDVDFQHQFSAAEHHDIIWGVRGNYSYDHSSNSPVAGLFPNSLAFKVFDGFIQDEIPFAADRFQFVLGSKFEHNDYTGFEWQPNARLAWTPDERQTAWLAVSRGVVLPSRQNRSLYVNLPPAMIQPDAPPIAVAYRGNPDAVSQKLLAYEAGYRKAVSHSLSLDVAAFYDVYRDLVTAEQGVPSLGGTDPLYLVIPFVTGNKMHGTTHGLEVSATWAPRERCKITGSYSWLNMQLAVAPDSRDPTSVTYAGQSAKHRFQLHSYIDLPRRFQFDSAMYFSSALSSWDIAPYTRLDLRLARGLGENAELSVVGQNLLSSRHLEAMAESQIPATSIRRSIYGQVIWRF